MAEAAQPQPVVAGFGTVEWTQEAPGIDSRSTVVDGIRWAVVRYAPGAARIERCTDGHRGYVLHGHMSYELDGGDRLDLPAGAAFWLPPGLGHRGVNGDVETQLFLIDVPDVGSGAEA